MLCGGYAVRQNCSQRPSPESVRLVWAGQRQVQRIPCKRPARPAVRGAQAAVMCFGERNHVLDVRIGNLLFEVKTASLGANGTFQCNHVRLDRPYDHLLCLGICPHQVVFDMWRTGAVAENRAGRLVRMAEGQAVTYKLTKRLGEMKPIKDLPARIQQVLTPP